MVQEAQVGVISPKPQNTTSLTIEFHCDHASRRTSSVRWLVSLHRRVVVELVVFLKTVRRR